MSRTKRDISHIKLNSTPIEKAKSEKHLEEMKHKFTYKCRCEYCLNIPKKKIVENIHKKEIKENNYVEKSQE